jgi:hypothetical protein
MWMLDGIVGCLTHLEKKRFGRVLVMERVGGLGTFAGAFPLALLVLLSKEYRTIKLDGLFVK